MGILAGAMSGAGEGLMKVGEHFSRSILQKEQQEAQRLRDERLAELRRGEMQYAEELRRAPAKAAAADIEKAKTGMVDDLSGTVRTRTPAEMAEAEESAFRKQGLVSEAMQVRQIEGQREERNQRMLDRSADNARADRAEDRAGRLADLQARTFDITAKGADLERQIKEITLKNAKRLDELREEFSKATPERQKTIQEEVRILTGKDNDNFLPVPLKDEFGNVTGYKIFDKRRGVWADEQGGGGGAQPTEADIAGLKSRASNPSAVQFFEAKFGQGSAAKYLDAAKADKPKPAPAAAPKTAASTRPAARDQRDYDTALEKTDAELRRLGNLARMPNIDRTLSTNAWIDYVDRLKTLRAGK